jgi:hypothetical protein
MMNQAPFDDHIKSKLSGYQPEVPPHIWENIMAEKDKRRPGGFIFFLKEHGLKLFIAAAVLTAGALFLLNKTNQVSNESISQVKSNRDVKNDPAASNNTSASSDIKNNTNTSNSTKDQSTLTSGSTTNNAVTDQTDNSTVTNNNPGNDKKQLSVTVSNVQSTGTNISSAGNNNRNNMINAVRTPNKPKKRIGFCFIPRMELTSPF